jgi:hypothetical protein
MHETTDICLKYFNAGLAEAAIEVQGWRELTIKAHHEILLEVYKP